MHTTLARGSRQTKKNTHTRSARPGKSGPTPGLGATSSVRRKPVCGLRVQVSRARRLKHNTYHVLHDDARADCDTKHEAQHQRQRCLARFASHASCFTKASTTHPSVRGSSFQRRPWLMGLVISRVHKPIVSGCGLNAARAAGRRTPRKVQLARFHGLYIVCQRRRIIFDQWCTPYYRRSTSIGLACR